MAQEKDKPDAGLRSLDHYKIRLPRWRYYIREKTLPFVRWETPYVAWLQHTLRTPFLDSYFAMTANLGTHTFFMTILPILFWCGNTKLARGMTQSLAAGVFFSGFVKDFLCLPRPLSPPLQRITMSGSAALEYGFPSTHSTNAVSAAIYAIFLLRSGTDHSSTMNLCLQGLAYFYAASIMIGRIYCGMHGFFDVFWGSLLGAAIAAAQCLYGDWFDKWLLGGDLKNVILVELVLMVLVRIHPEPADDCPCFDDSVAFAGVVAGIQIGGWHYAQTAFASSIPMPSTVPFDLHKLGWPVVIARIVIGVIIVFAWRSVMKPTLLMVLPPVFRIIEHYGLTLPRRFFTPASQYKTVPEQRDDDNVIPSAREIPGFLSNLRHRRAISIGPQSEADAYEALAFREKKRRDSTNAPIPATTSPLGAHQPEYSPPKTLENGFVEGSRKRASSLDQYKAQMGEAGSPVIPAFPDSELDGNAEDVTKYEEQQAKELFAHLQKPRVRYDVEVITKLIVYSGIAWWAVEGIPIVFDLIGLGVM
jgi:dihydrosphingosine 1-phosphate phosphatase